ncbi:MAG: hypothetical protein IT581_12435 [Verrucomicrobiales bacterium]|nr:hypothetical protein [Verrucomicrobiales bacterium]
MIPATLSLAWDFFGRRRSRWLLVTTALIVGWLGIRWTMVGPREAWMAPALARSITAFVLLLSFSAMDFTEGHRRGGFGTFPMRMFRLPVSTAMLVAVPMVGAALAMASAYLLCARLLLSLVGDSPPLLWPCLYLVGGVAAYQATIWALAEHPWCRTAALGFETTILAFGWMFLWPDIYAGTLSDAGYTGNPDQFMTRYLVGLSLIGPAAYLVAWNRIRASRHPSVGRRVAAGVRPAHSNAARRANRRPFGSAGRALYWMEMRRSGWVLPGVMVVVLGITSLPTAIVALDGGSVTAGVVAAMLVAPTVMAAIVGCAFRRPDFWIERHSLSSFQLVLPVTAGSRILAKLICALTSSAMTWVVTSVAIVAWVVYFGDFRILEVWKESLLAVYSPFECQLLAIGTTATLILLTWRFLVAGLPFGPGAHPWLRRTSDASVAAGVCGLLLIVTQHTDTDGSARDFHDVGPLVRYLPALLFGLIMAKTCFAWAMWRRVQRRGLLADRWIAVYWASWLVMAAIPGATACLAFSKTNWLWPLLALAGVLAVPLGRVAVAILAWSQSDAQR